MQERVQKIIAAAGICSRRNAEELIKKGRVKVNDKVITIGSSADPQKDIIKVNNKVIKKQEKHYILLNKPEGYVTTCKDPRMKNTVLTIPSVKIYKAKTRARLYPVGRLDKNTSGLLILTNDGDFANKIMHPRYEIEKSYLVALHKPIMKRDLQKIRQGVMVDGKKTWPAKAQRLNPVVVRVTIHEGRNRIVRKMFQAINYKVVALERIAIGNIEINDLKYGQIRKLTKEEIQSLSPRKQTNHHKIHKRK